MSEVSIEVAASTLPEIIDRLTTDGQPVVVTRAGKPVATITRAATAMAPIDLEGRQQFLRTLDELRTKVKPMTEDEIVAMVREGRPQR